MSELVSKDLCPIGINRLMREDHHALASSLPNSLVFLQLLTVKIEGIRMRKGPQSSIMIKTTWNKANHKLN